MSNNPKENDGWDLDSILGHPRREIALPSLSANPHDQSQWATEAFLKNVFSLIPAYGRDRLTFVDMFFARPVGGEFFGAVVVKEGLLEPYKNLLASVLNDGFTVGSHPVFQKKDFTINSNGDGLHATENFLFWLDQADDLQKKPTGSNFEAKWLDPKSLFASGKSYQWLQNELVINTTSLEDCWIEYCKRIKEAPDFSPISFVSGIPISITIGGDRFPVAGLFLGGTADGSSPAEKQASAKRVVSSVSRSLVAYALRAYAFQHLERAQELQKNLAKTEIYDRIHGLLKQLTSDFSRANNTLQSIDATITTSNEDFLAHFAAMKRIFENKRIVYHYQYRISGATTGTSPNSARTIDISDVTIDQLDKGDNYEKAEFTSVHANCVKAEWNSVRQYLERYGQAKKLPVIEAFSALSIPAVGSDDALARKYHALFKQTVFNSQAHAKRLFPLQIAICAATAWAYSADKEVVVELDGKPMAAFKTGDERLVDVTLLATFIKEIVGHSKVEQLVSTDSSIAPYFQMRESCEFTTAEVLGSVMRLVGSELVSFGNEERAVATKVIVDIKEAFESFDVKILCDGHFSQLEKMTVGDNAELHGMKGCLRVICGGVGQDQPIVVAAPNEAAMAEVFRHSPQTRIGIANFTNDDKNDDSVYSCVFLRFPLVTAATQ